MLQTVSNSLHQTPIHALNQSQRLDRTILVRLNHYTQIENQRVLLTDTGKYGKIPYVSNFHKSKMTMYPGSE